MKILKNKIRKEYVAEKIKGFTLLFSILVATLVVAIGATIISVALRQTILSGTSRESQYAFYAANTALECAFYWDLVGIPSNLQIPGTIFKVPGETLAVRDGSGVISPDISCAGEPLEITTSESNGEHRSTFSISIRNQETISGMPDYEYCGLVTIIKTLDSNGSGPEDDIIKTTIEAKGRNNACGTTNSRTVERGLIQVYES